MVSERDKQLVDRHRRQFAELFETQARPVLGYALRRVSQPADAADVVAETFLVAWRRLDVVPALTQTSGLARFPVRVSGESVAGSIATALS